MRSEATSPEPTAGSREAAARSPEPPAAGAAAAAAASPEPTRAGTYPMFVGGRFTRGRSGRTHRVGGVTVPLAGPEDVDDAVAAARAALAGWSGATAYHRGRVLYRVAESLEARAAAFTAIGIRADELRLAVDRWVWYAGWADKVAQVCGRTHPVAGPYLTVSVPEPVGVVGVAAPSGSRLLGLVSVVAPPVVVGNTAVVLAAETDPLPAVTLAEVLATSDVPGGVVNILTGRLEPTATLLGSHEGVDALDLTGVDEPLAARLESLAAARLAVVRRASGPVDWRADPGTTAMTDLLRTRTVWHPQGT